ncbi:sensor histidine kinase [Streptococcus sp. DD10]|uniref:sensor histidine kinase n=1 Tax=Streptococcus sp. DD10 TaxID=1777878 RepID=UPI0018D3BF05|nr:HAMP domain-containing sensor histidine kinase [Streptococcus sp. DD10]
MILLLVLLALTLFYLVRYVLALRSLSRQIQAKIASGSQTRLTSNFHSSSLVELTDQVESLFEQIDKTNIIAMQEKKTLDMAISNIAHDIRTPLTIASGYTQQLERKDQVDMAVLEKIKTNLMVVSKRLEALLEYRRLQEGAQRVNMVDVQISQRVIQQVFNYYDAFQKAEIELDLQVEEGLSLQTDPDLLERLLQNLLSNVLKHGKEEAVLTLAKTDGQVILAIKNRVQHPIQHLDKLTNRFYSENLSDTEESSGLGLYISQQLTEVLGGDFQLASQGDWFEVTVAL